MNYMRFLGLSFWIMLVIVLVGCAQNKPQDKKVVNEGSSPSSSMENRNGSYEAGKMVYDRHCKVCHQANRMGISKIYPPIKNTKRVKGDKAYLIDVVLNGLSGEIKVEGVKYKGVMAPYKNLSDQQIADVINYIRNDSDGAKDMVSVDEVKQRR